MLRGEPTFGERPPRLSEEEQKLYEMITPDTERRRIDVSTFGDLYGAEVIKRDLAEVERLERLFEEQQRDPQQELAVKRGHLFEAIVNDQIESSNWLGPDATVIVPSRFDDIKNGVDGIVEFEEERGKSHLALAIDVTKSGKHMDDKIEAIRKSIEEGRLSKIKYFQSEDMRGEKSEVPRVVVGADQNTIHEVADLLLTFKTRKKFPDAGKPGEFKMVRGKLEHHRLQYIILFEIKKQLETFQAYATQAKQPKIAEKYEEAASLVSAILKEKNKEAGYSENHPDLTDDEVYSLIMEKMKKFTSLS